MKVKIGKYLTWYGPYKLFGWLEPYIGEDRMEKLADVLAPACQWVHDKRHMTIKVKIDDYDTWNADHTLAHIIYPLLIEFRKELCGAPFVDNEDVPFYLWVDDSKYNEEGGHDDLFFARWDWVLDEMIWAFKQEIDDWMDVYLSAPDYDFEKSRPVIRAHEERIRRGFVFFGKYYQNLWD